MTIRKFAFVLIGCLLLSAAAFASDSTKADTKAPEKIEMKKADKEPAKAEGKKESKEPEWVTTESGLKYRDITIGVGEPAQKTDRVETHYSLWLADGDKPGKKLQSSKDAGETFAFAVGQPGLIKGWNEGMIGMKPGGVRQLIIPPDIGYGAQGRQPLVPGNATLFFEIDLVKNISVDTRMKKDEEK